ncbi:MAG: helicase HerA-like domain-containing protein [Actinomycetota bacterium]
MDEAFLQEMAEGYAFEGDALVFGGAMLGDEVDTTTRIRLPLSMVNRHGLVAGATGTGKTKTLQLMAGQLSGLGVPVFVADVKGDLSGVSKPGTADAPHVAERCASLGWTFEGHEHPVELLSLSGALGARVRATVHSFGPILLSKVLDLNKTQTSVLSMVFKYCDDQALPLLDLADLRTTLKFLSSDQGKPVLEEYGGMSPATVGVLLRSLVDLEQQGAAGFFGEPEFDVADLLRVTPEGKGVISLLELSDVMDRPRLFSTFMLWMLAQVYAELPEAGDLPTPKLAFFFDEAHLLFDDASDALMDQIELTARLIRSKGVGVYFVTQAPTDVPSSVLSQLGNRIQHALRAFTPEDETNLRKTVRTMPKTEFYEVQEVLTSLGIGEALITVLSPKGVPTPLAATRLVPPDSLMQAVDEATLQELLGAGALGTKYAQDIDRESAHEIINARLGTAKEAAGISPAPAGGVPLPPPPDAGPATAAPTAKSVPEPAVAKKKAPATKKAGPSTGDQVKDIATGFAKDMFTTADGRNTLRSVFGTLFGKK